MTQPRLGFGLKLTMTLLALGASAALVGTWACSSSSSSGANSGCASNPAQCATGTTCWPADTVPNLKCLPSKPGNGFGATCTQTPGTATCADGLACDQTSAAGGTCTYYCGNGGQTCPAGYACFTTHVGSANGPAIDICRPQGLPGGEGGVPLDGGLVDDGSLCWDAIFSVEGGADSGNPM